jgi:predicted Rdx family selenoprotein
MGNQLTCGKEGGRKTNGELADLWQRKREEGYPEPADLWQKKREEVQWEPADMWQKIKEADQIDQLSYGR